MFLFDTGYCFNCNTLMKHCCQ